MADYTIEAVVKLRVKGVENFIDAAERAEEFFSIGLENLAYSDDEDDDIYAIEDVRINWGSVERW